MRISEITISDGRRALNDAAVERLVESIGSVGLINPISVDKGGTLVAGLHRLKACEALGWTEIPVIVLDVDELHAELAEIDEDLCRHDGSALERAERLARRKVLYEQLHPETRANVAGGKARHGSAGDNLSFAADTAAKTGLSERTIQRDVRTSQALAPDVRDTIRDTPLADNKSVLSALASEPAERQRELVAQGPDAIREAAREKRQAKPSLLAPQDRAEASVQPAPPPSKLTPEERERLREMAKGEPEPDVLPGVLKAIDEALRILADESEAPNWRIEDATKVLAAARKEAGR